MTSGVRWPDFRLAAAVESVKLRRTGCASGGTIYVGVGTIYK